MIDAVATATQQGSPETTSTTHYDYDEFERRTGSWTQVDGGPREHEATFAYDGLDRRDTRTKPNDEVIEYSYVGTSESLAREARLDGSNTRTYDYDSAGRRQGQTRESTYRAYAKDANGSVEGIEQPDGEIPADDAYHYDPYGELETDDDASGEPQDPEEELGPEARENPFRFEGFYYDSGVKTYDMLARSYRPEIGRFTSQDRYEAASDDLELQSDPLTQNRYAFAGGNPVSRVEFDGHCSYNRGGKRCLEKFRRGRAKRVVVTTADGRALSFGSQEALDSGSYKELPPSYTERQQLTTAIEQHPVFGQEGPDIDWSEIKQTSNEALRQAVEGLDRFHDAYAQAQSESEDGSDPGATLRAFGRAVEMFAINAGAAAAGRGNPLGKPLGKLATRLTVVAAASDFVAGLQMGESVGASGRRTFFDVGTGLFTARTVAATSCSKGVSAGVFPVDSRGWTCRHLRTRATDQ